MASLLIKNGRVVTADSNTCSTFRAEASQLLKLDERSWKTIRDILEDALEKNILATRKTVRLVPEVQFVSLKLALRVLCGHDSKLADDQTIYKLAHDINCQWIWSKTATEKSSGSILPSIKNALGDLFPKWKEAGYPASSK